MQLRRLRISDSHRNALARVERANARRTEACFLELIVARGEPVQYESLVWSGSLFPDLPRHHVDSRRWSFASAAATAYTTRSSASATTAGGPYRRQGKQDD